MIKTESAAIELTATLWKIKAETGLDKFEILQALGFGDIFSCVIKFGCPCCDYVKDIGETPGYGISGCLCNEICPLRGLWPGGCLAKGSPYKKHMGFLARNIKTVRKYYALKIAKFAGELAGTWWEP